MKERFCFQPTALDGVVVVERRPIVDERGWFERLFCARELESLTGGKPIVQINRSLTHRRGAVRGLHYQRPPYAEIKIVTCLRGEIFDVAVDGELIYSKHKTGRFPDHAEIDALLDARSPG